MTLSTIFKTKPKKEQVLFFISVVWIFTILSAWDVRQALFLGESFNKLAVGDYWVLSNYISWMPIAVEVSEGNLFPGQNLAESLESHVGLLPYISLWLSGLLIHIFGAHGATLVGSILFPVLSYILMVLIYKRYLPMRWAISLASLGILGFSSAPFRDFIAGLLAGEGWVELGVNQFPDILNFPFPSISLLSFLAMFFFSTQRLYMSKRRSVLLSIFWSLQVYVHAVNAIIGIPFWLVFFGITIWRSNRNLWNKRQTKHFLLQLAIIVLVCMPAIVTTLYQTSGAELEFLVARNTSDLLVDWSFIAAYFILPVVTLIIAYWVFRIDPHELVFKFLPIGIIMFVELAIILLWQIAGVGIPEELLLTRIGLYFLHIFYFAPSIYCMHRTVLGYHSGTESLQILGKIRFAISWVLKNASSVYLPIFVVLLTAFSIASSERSFQYFQENVVQTHQDSSAVFDLLIEGSKPGDTLVGPNNIVNASLMSNNQYKTLWSNSIVSGVSVNVAIERFALYAKIIGWSEDQYLAFMLPSKSFSKYSSKKINLLSSDPVSGLGYWLTLHNKVMGSKEKEDLTSYLLNAYRSINIKDKLLKYNVKKIIIDKQSKYAKDMRGRVDGQYKIINLNNL